MAKEKTANDLRKEPNILMRSTPELPVNTAIDQLTQLSGDRLEISTRSSPMLARAASVGYIYSHTFGSGYVQGRIEQVERLAVSNGGEGRKDMIEAVRAGGRMPDAYYQGGRGSKEFRGMWEVDE